MSITLADKLESIVSLAIGYSITVFQFLLWTGLLGAVSGCYQSFKM